jgi:hypothetical protein
MMTLHPSIDSSQMQIITRTDAQIVAISSISLVDYRINADSRIGPAIPSLPAILRLRQDLVSLLDLHEFLLSLAPFLFRSLDLVRMVIPG